MTVRSIFRACVLIKLGSLTLFVPTKPAQAEGYLQPFIEGRNNLHRNITGDDLDAFATTLRESGRIVIDVEMENIVECTSLNKRCLRFHLVSAPNTENRGWDLVAGVPKELYDSRWRTNRDRNFRPMDIEAVTRYISNPGRPGGDVEVYYSGLWIDNRENLAWASFSAVEASRFDREFRQRVHNGSMVLVDRERTGFNGQRVAAIFVRPRADRRTSRWRPRCDARSAEDRAARPRCLRRNPEIRRVRCSGRADVRRLRLTALAQGGWPLDHRSGRVELSGRSTLPMATVIEAATGPWGSTIVALVAVLMALGTLNAVVMSNPRTLYGMAEDGLFLKSALRVNSGGTPTFALALGTVLAIPLIYSGGYVFVFRLAGAMVLFGSCLFVLSYFALRKNRPDLDRPFRAKGHPVFPALALLINFALLTSFVIAEPISGAVMAGMIAICIPVGIHLQRQRRLAAEAAALSG